MKYRIGMWACMGFLVAACWAIYAFARPIQLTTVEPMATLVRVTCPISLFSYLPIRLYWVLLANAATYALVGMMFEMLRGRIRHAN